MVTMADVAKAAGVSTSLVSLAFRDAYGVSEETKTHILAVAERMHYTPNTVASRLARKVNTTFGVFLLDLHNEVFVDMFDGMRTVASAAGRDLVISVGSTGGTLDRPALESLVQARVDVIIAAGLLLPDTEIARFTRQVPMVSVARLTPGADSVVSDNVEGARLAVTHLAELGHRDVLHLAAPISDGYTERREGYADTMRAFGLEPHVVTVDYSRAEAAKIVGELIDAGRPPTAVFAHNDQTALGVLDALHVRGLRAPEDISVIGYDNTSVTQNARTSLTTVDLHAQALGERAAELALRRSADRSAELVVETSRPTLIPRSTTGPPRRDT